MNARYRASPEPTTSPPTRGGSDRDRPPVGGSAALELPRRSFLADFLAIGGLGFVVFGVLFSWLAARSSSFGETFSDIFWETGIWSGLIFGVVLGAVFAWLLTPRATSHAITSPEALRSRLTEVLPKMRLKIRGETTTEILLSPTKRPPLPILREETVHLALTATQVTITAGRMVGGRLRRKLQLR